MTGREAYNSLAGFIKNYIYEKEWETLNPMQIAAIEKVQEHKSNLLFTAGTAMGKTEAAFMPTISELYQHPVNSIGILYISPLKALINDQFIRIEDMLLETTIKITKWHGDSSYSQKNKLLNHPNGILQTTPESLEAMLCRHPENVSILFSETKYIIIDEIHYFMNSGRGLQLLALLERIQRITKQIPIRLGLSATIKNTKKALEFLNAGSNRGGEVIDNGQESRTYQVSVTVTESGESEDIPLHYMEKLFVEAYGKRALLFTNSRRECEVLIAGMKKLASDQGLPNIYYVHHGSISKELRENTEEIMKHQDGPILTATTLTLELGIDIGDLDEVIQASQPLSISSMVQRVGRSGRKTKKSAIAFHLRYREADRPSMEGIDLQLVRSIAMIELYFREKYLEEIEMAQYPYHLLIHEILSMICQKGCLYPRQLAAEVLELSIFQKISQEEMKEVLRSLIASEVLMVYDDGAIGLADVGERICNQMEFYAVFESVDTFSVRWNEKEIGSVEKAYKQGDRFFLAGQSWRVIGCDLTHKRIDVEVCLKSADIHFTGSGILQTDQVTMAKIHEILASNAQYSYLDEEALQVLTKLREKAERYHFLDLIVEEDCTDNLLLFPILGTSTINTLYYLFVSVGVRCEQISLRGFLFGLRLYATNRRKLQNKVFQILESNSSIQQEFLLKNEKLDGKYTEYLSDELKYKEIVADTLDMEGARLFLRNLIPELL